MTGEDRADEPTTTARGRTNRRRFLTVLGALGITGTAGCGGDGDGTPTETDGVGDADGTDTGGAGDADTSGPTTTTSGPAEPERLVGAHYYPWYDLNGSQENWAEYVVSDPVLGEYAADDPAVIDQHLTWCLKHGIRWLSASWWGPGSNTDDALRNAVLDAERADELQFSVLYETVGRLGEYEYDLNDEAARDRLREDLRYLDAEYFGRDNYLHMEGRPVVFFYVANLLAGDVSDAFEAATADLATDPYVLADVPFGTPPGTYPVTRVADAVTTYNPYAARPDIEEVFHDRYEHGTKVMHLGADASGVAHVPTVIPGYDDTGLPDSQREDNPVLAPSPERYERVCEQVAPHLEDSPAVLVTSFNEWYEDTQIEPGEDHGEAYLELTAERLVTGSSSGFDPDGTTIRFAFDRTVVPAEGNPASSDTRPLAFMAGGLGLLADGDAIRSYAIGDLAREPLFLDGVYGIESNDDRVWRWFGGASGETVLFIEETEAVARADSLVLVGQPVRSDLIEADVSVDGTAVGHIAFRDRDGFEEYTVQL
jgi:glycoprotein endo-alpha-1,2-mannosidase